MNSLRYLGFISVFLLLGQGLFAQSFYRPWASYTPVKPQKPYERIDTVSTKLRQEKCSFKGISYEPNEIITRLDIKKEEVFNFFKNCCATHTSRCIATYIGQNNKTLLYTLVENKAYRYMNWILNEGFVYDAYIDQWGIYNEINGTFAPVRNYNPMMLACKTGDLTAAQILRKRGAYLSQPQNAINLTAYDFAMMNSEEKDPVFINFIQQEYKEELDNINANKQYGTSFSIGYLQEFIESFKTDFHKNQQKVIEKAIQINKA